MRLQLTVGLLGLGMLASPLAAQTTPATGRINPMIALHEKGLPVFGITHPSLTPPRAQGAGGAGAAGAGAPGARAGAAGAPGAAAGGRAGGGAGGAVAAGGGAGGGRAGGGAGAGAAAAGGAGGGRAAGGGVAAAPATPPVPVDLAAAARETLAYKLGDFQYAGATNDAFYDYMAQLIRQGGSARTHAFIEKIPLFAVRPASNGGAGGGAANPNAPATRGNPEQSKAAMYHQLRAGQVGVMMQEVESAQEVRDAAKAMTFVSQGGTRPDNDDLGLAPMYWGLTQAEYRQKAAVWPLNPNGELIIWAIVESKTGLAKVREIAAEPAVGVLWAGAGTLGGVFTTTNAAGERVRDQAAYDKALADVLAACKEFRKPCGYPISTPAEMEQRMKEGWSVFVMQSRNDNGFASVIKGRELSGRPTTP